MFIEGQELSRNFATVKFEIEHCVDSKPYEQCPNTKEIQKFWSKAIIFVFVGYKQIDVKNMTHP